ncbi:MAG TPA: PIN domain-containing protein [Vicinamibacterales bacterium]|nr:PIN domain-containing protein [Vicinamibacterales bacterium]
MTGLRVVLDTGIAYALADKSDAWHRRALDWIKNAEPELTIPVTILPEVSYLVRSRRNEEAERRYVQTLAEDWESIEPLREHDVLRASDLMRTYRALGFVDASIVAIAERLRVEVIATTDRRDFSLVRPRHVTRFTLVP